MNEQTGPANLVEAAKEAGGFDTFVSIVERSGLNVLLQGPARHTVFAPTDDAFASLPQTARDKIDEGQSEFLKAIVKGHMVIGRVRAERFNGRRMSGKAVGGAPLTIAGDDGISVNGAIVVRPNIMAGNGVLHGVDRVLWPNTLGAAPQS
jgi:uncharacterized surface protein with fasciclin (FAS1) repeats